MGLLNNIVTVTKVSEQEKIEKLYKLAIKHGKSVSELINTYVALGTMFEDLLADDKEIVLVKRSDVDKITVEKEVVPFRFLLEVDTKE